MTKTKKESLFPFGALESFRHIPRSCEVCGKTMFIDRDEEKNNPKFSKDFYKKFGYHAVCGHRECPAYMKYI